ncbi:MAG: hypothetical protein ABW223_09810 [Rariglobus sp.]
MPTRLADLSRHFQTINRVDRRSPEIEKLEAPRRCTCAHTHCVIWCLKIAVPCQRIGHVLA